MIFLWGGQGRRARPEERGCTLSSYPTRTIFAQLGCSRITLPKQSAFRHLLHKLIFGILHKTPAFGVELQTEGAAKKFNRKPLQTTKAMFKYLSLTAALIPLIAEIAVMPPLAAESRSPYPVFPGTDLDMLVCYVQMEDGRTLDLGSLCRKKSVTPVSDTRSDDSGISTTDSNPDRRASEAFCIPEGAPECIRANLNAPFSK